VSSSPFSEFDKRQELQLRAVELEQEFEAEDSVRVQVSPTSWLRIPKRAAKEHADLSAMVREAREQALTTATERVERHRDNLISGGEIEWKRMQSLTYLLKNGEMTWREPTSSLAQEALRSLLHTEHGSLLLNMLQLLLADGKAQQAPARGAIRLLVMVAVPANSGQFSSELTSQAHSGLSSSALSASPSAELIADLLTRLHLDTGHAHYVLLLQELTEETSFRPDVASYFLTALEATHQTYSEECHDRSTDNYLDYHDLQVSLCSASLAYITGAADANPAGTGSPPAVNGR